MGSYGGDDAYEIKYSSIKSWIIINKNTGKQVGRSSYVSREAAASDLYMMRLPLKLKYQNASGVGLSIAERWCEKAKYDLENNKYKDNVDGLIAFTLVSIVSFKDWIENKSHHERDKICFEFGCFLFVYIISWIGAARISEHKKKDILLKFIDKFLSLYAASLDEINCSINTLEIVFEHRRESYLSIAQKYNGELAFLKSINYLEYCLNCCMDEVWPVVDDENESACIGDIFEQFDMSTSAVSYLKSITPSLHEGFIKLIHSDGMFSKLKRFFS